MSAAPFRWKLVFQSGSLSGQECHLPEGELTLGAGHQWDIDLLRLNSQDQHCILRVSPESVTLLPLKMRCKINQRYIKQQQITLQPGQTVSIANCTFTLARAGEAVYLTSPRPRRRWLRILGIALPAGCAATILIALLYASQALHTSIPKISDEAATFNLDRYQRSLSDAGLFEIRVERDPNGTLTLSGSCWETSKLEPFLNQLVEKEVVYRNQVTCQDNLEHSVAYILRANGYRNAQITAGPTLGSVIIFTSVRANARWANVSHQLNQLPGLKTWTVSNNAKQTLEPLISALRENNLLTHLSLVKQDDILTITGQLQDNQRQSLQQILDNYQQQQQLRIVYQDTAGLLPAPPATAPIFTAASTSNPPAQTEIRNDLWSSVFRSASWLSSWFGFPDKAAYWSLKALNAKLQGQGVDPEYVAIISRRYGVPLPLALKVIWIESRGRHTGADGNVLTSSKGALGMMQLMPSTAKELHIDPLNAQDNIRGGIMYLAQLSRKYQGNWEKVVAAYNWGQGNVDLALIRYGENWQQALPKESSNYLAQVRQ